MTSGVPLPKARKVHERPRLIIVSEGCSGWWVVCKSGSGESMNHPSPPTSPLPNDQKPPKASNESSIASCSILFLKDTSGVIWSFFQRIHIP